MSIDPAAAAIGAKLIEVAARGLGSGAIALPAVAGLAPAGAEEVSLQAAASFAAEGEAMLALTSAAQEELARAGAALMDIARVYSEADDAAAGLIRSATLPGAAGSAARTPLLANLLDGVAAVNPSAMVPAAGTVASALLAAAGAASTVLGVATGPPSAISSFSQGASAGGAAGPALASAVVENDDQSGPDGTGEQSGGALI
ncbi:PE family protein [Mycobacterium servetii]|uniref:PE family protein n=1 Tax=Mycobacterium servetii TaxID=3237418 RepID=A0ABV4C122_9MYCO